MRSWRAPTTAALVATALVGSAALAGPAAGQAPEEAAGTAPYIVVLDDDAASRRDVTAHADAAGGDAGHVYDEALAGWSAELTPDEVAELEADDAVAYVAEDVPLELYDQVVPPGVARVYGPANPATGIGAPTDRRVDVDIAIVDSGVDDHEDLDVVRRVDCLPDGGCRPGGYDSTGHGTHVAGTAAAVNNGAGVVGTAPGARVWSSRVCDGGDCATSDVVAALDDLIAHADEVEVANMSLGGFGPNPPLRDAITATVDAGIVVVAAAGNDAREVVDDMPGAHPDVVTVGALADSDGLPGGQGGPPSCDTRSQDDHLAWFSNWGTAVEVVAPGACVRSTTRDGGYGTKSGTSMAAPHVAGAAGLLTSGADAPDDRADVLAVRSTLVATGNDGWEEPSHTPRPLLDLRSPSYAPDLLAPPAGGPWKERAAVPGGRAQFAEAQCAEDRDGYYVVAGATGPTTPVATAWRYDHLRDVWEQRSAFPGTAREGLAAACTPDGRIHVVGGGSNQHWVYDIGDDAWAPAAALPRATWHPAVAAWADKVYVAGGLATPFGGPTAQVDVFDTDAASGPWSAGPPLPQAVGRAGFARSGSSLYVVGGWAAGSPGTNATATLRLDMQAGTWSSGPAFASGRADVGLVATDDSLYALGGLAPGATLTASDRAERLDIDAWPSGAWAALPSLPAPAAMSGAACSPAGPNAHVGIVGGVSFGAGGGYSTAHRRMLVLGEACGHVRSDEWEPAAGVPTGTVRFGGVSCPGDARYYYKFGGLAAFQPQNTAWRYDAVADTWSPLAPMPQPRDGAAAACVAGKVHLLGGSVPGTGGTSDHLVYDIATDRWSTAAALPRATTWAAAGAYGNRLYLVGGSGPGGPSAEVNVFDLTTGAWAGTAGPLARPTERLGYAQSGRYLYLAGGTSGGASVADTARIDMTTGARVAGAPLTGGARSDVALVATDTAVHALGGTTVSLASPTDRAERIPLASWTTGPWTAGPRLPTPLWGGSGACVANGGNALLGMVGGGGPGSGGLTLDQHWHRPLRGERCAPAT